MRNITFKICPLNRTLLIAMFVLIGYSSLAQVKAPFAPRFSDKVNGDIAMIANNVVSEHPTNDYTGASDNNSIFSVFVDIDSDGTTFNSSSANLVNPSPASSCLTFRRAYLYWAAANKENGPDNNGNMTGNGNPEVVWPYDQVKVMLPGSSSYTTMTADEVIFNGRAEHFVNDPYVCIKDITSEVQALANPYGKFQVANVKATVGSLYEHIDFDDRNTGTSGGWQIVFVYESPQLVSKNITLFDGYANVTQTDNSFDILFDGFQTVPNGPVNANILIGSTEGDRGIMGDQLQIFDTDGVWTSLLTNERAEDNFFNSKITVNESQFLDRNPASTNTLGFDASLFELRNNGRKLIDNDQTSATFRLTSNQETYGLYLLGLSVEVFEPSLGALSFTTNVIGSNFDPGDNAPVEIRIKNVGNDNIQNLEIALTLPPQVEFLNTEPLPPGVTFNFDSGIRELRFFVEDGYTDIDDPEYELDFNLAINNECVTCSADIGLQALAIFTGETNPNTVGTLSSGTVDACGIGNHDPTILHVTPVLSIDDGSATEGNNIVFNISSSHLLAEDALLNLAYTNNTASASDYAIANTFTVPTGTGNTSFGIPALDDTIIEATETFDIVASSAANITLLDNTATGSIIDNDDAAPGDGISFTSPTVSVLEGNTAADNTQLSFELTYTGTIPAGETVSVDYATVTGTADGSDFVEITTQTIQFTQATKSLFVLVDVIEDTNIENDEDFTLVLSNITTANGFVTGFVDGNTTNTKTGTIQNDDNAGAGDGISFTSPTVSVLEGNTAADNTQLSFELTYTGTIPAGETVSVDYATVTGTADGSDFVEITTQTISFTAANTSQTILVDVIEDTNIENDEDFTLVLSNITTANGFVTGFVDGNTTNTKIGTIQNDDNAGAGDGISFTSPTVSVLEGNTAADNTQLSFELTYTGTIPAGETVSVDYATVTGTADGSDFVEITTQTIQFTQATKSLFVLVDVIEDTNIENDEDFTLVLSNITTANGFVTGFVDGNTTNTKTGTIQNDDNAGAGDGISFTSPTVSVLEGNTAADNTQLSFEVTYTGTIPAGETVSVDYATVTGTADNSDFVEITTQTISFTAANTSQTILVDVIEDTNIENDEDFTLVLSNITTANGFVTGFVDGNTTNTKIGTIQNDDNAGAGDGISFTSPTVSVLEGNTAADNTQLSFELTYTGTIPAGETVSVDYATVTGTADGSDFVEITTQTIQFTQATKSLFVLVDVIEDTNIENDEDFTLVLSNITTANGFVTGFVDGNTTNTKTGTIQNDDNAGAGDGISFTSPTVSVLEGNTAADNTQLSFELTYTGTIPAGETVSVDYATVTGTADNSDFVEITTQTISFTAANTSQTILVDVIEDTNIENDEDFTLVLSNITTANGFVTGFVDGNTTNTATGIIDNDDSVGTGSGISVADFSVNEDVGTVDFVITYTGPTVQDAFTIAFEITDGSAISPDDYTTVVTIGNVSFPAITATGTTQTVTITIIDDTTSENTEDLNITLSNISNPLVPMVDANGAGSIIDNDMAEIMVEPYEETLTMICGDNMPEVPTLVFTGGCSNYTVDFTEVEDFSTGTDDFLIVRTWNVTDSCGNTASFQQVIFVLQRERSLIELDICVEDEVIDLIDSLPSGFDTSGTFTVTQGDVTLEGSLFDPNGLELGEYLITYESTVNSCNYFADYVINVNADCLPCDLNDLVVSKTITVNGDGINDFFEISGLEDCGYTYNVKIFNRWGTMVYESQEYRNNWEGNAPGGSFGTNSTVPTGTYYYIIAFSNAEIKPINGYIYIGSN